MVTHQTLDQEFVIWNHSLPVNTLQQSDIKYLEKAACQNRPTVEWIWNEMDREWNALGLNNRVPLQSQPIADFYSHPVWVINGVFSAVDPDSVQHRDAIAKFVSSIDAKHIADYGGGFGELALKLHAVDPKTYIDIVEPFPSKIGMLRVEGKTRIQFTKVLDKQYDCIIAQDVLEHVETPLDLTLQMVLATKLGGYLIFANCFYPVIKCHLPSTFYLRHTFIWLVNTMGLKFVSRVEGAEHALIFKRVGNVNKNLFVVINAISKFVGPILNIVFPLLNSIRLKFGKS